MPHLVPPTVRAHLSFLEAMEEFEAERASGSSEAVDRDPRSFRQTWHDPVVFADYVARVRADALEEAPRPEGFVPCTTLWFIDGDEYLGRIAIRHRFTPWLLEYGGHIGYDVRPSARRRGHATAMLRAALPVAAALGIDPALVTCDAGNTASRKVIEANHGVFEDRRGVKLRYWVRAKDSFGS